jgi:tetratricopeptide (TPR) repeat protein
MATLPEKTTGMPLLSPTPTVTLGLYHAVVAIEWLNWKTLTDTQKTQCQTLCQQKGLVFGATLDRDTGSYQFLRITHAPDAPSCADTAVQLAMALVRAIGQAGLSCRIGLDMELADDKDPLCGIAQRVSAPENGVVASQRLMDSLLTHYPQQPVEHGIWLTDPLTTQASSPTSDTFADHAVDGDAFPPPDAITTSTLSEANVPADLTTPNDLPPNNPETTDNVMAAPAVATDLSPAASAAHTQATADEAINNPVNLNELEHQAVPVYWQPGDSSRSSSSVQQVNQQLLALMQNHLQLGEQGQLVVLTGHEGAGKTRLIGTVLQQTLQQVMTDNQTDDPPCFWMHGQAGPPFAPLGLWQSVISRFYHITPLGMPTDQLQQVIGQQALHPDDFNQQWQMLMGIWFGWQPLQGLDDSFVLQPRLLASLLMGFFQLLGQHKPVVLLLDDLEEADSASLDVLMELLAMGLCHQLPVLVIITHNSDAMPIGPWAEALKPAQALHLPLPQGDALTDYLQHGPLQAVWGQFPPPLLEQLCTLSQGNPLIIEECLRLLFLKGALHPLTGPSLSLEAAEPVMVFAERFALLPESTQITAHWFAVIGQPITADIVPLLTPLTQPDEDINHLKEHGILVEDASGGLIFRHRLLQQWVYQTLPEALRQPWHNQLAEKLDILTEEKRWIPYAFLAEQAELADELELAAHAWSAAGVWSAHLHSLTGFNLAMVRSAQLFKNQPHMLDNLSLVMRYLGQINAHDLPHVTTAVLPTQPVAHQDVSASVAESEQLQQWLTRITSQEASGQFSQGLDVLSETLATLSATPDSQQEQVYLYAQQAKWQLALGLLPQADDTLKHHVMPALADATDHPLHALAWLDAYTTRLHMQLLNCRPELFDTLDLMMSHPYLAQPPVHWQLLMARVFRFQGHDTRAQETLNQLQLGDPAEVQLWHIEQAMLHNQRGQFEKALGACHVAFNQPLTSDWHRVQLLIAQGNAYLSVEKWEQASQTIKEAVARAMDGQYRLQVLDAKLLWCRALIATKQWPQADKQLQLLWQQSQQTGQVPVWHQYHVAMSLSETMRKQGQVLEAGRLLEPLWKTVTDSRQLPLVAQMAEQVGRFYMAMAQQSETPKAQAQTAMQFLQRAQRLWQQMQNPYQADKFNRILAPR